MILILLTKRERSNANTNNNLQFHSEAKFNTDLIREVRSSEEHFDNIGVVTSPVAGQRKGVRVHVLDAVELTNNGENIPGRHDRIQLDWLHGGLIPIRCRHVRISVTIVFILGHELNRSGVKTVILQGILKQKMRNTYQTQIVDCLETFCTGVHFALLCIHLNKQAAEITIAGIASCLIEFRGGTNFANKEKSVLHSHRVVLFDSFNKRVIPTIIVAVEQL